jgi:hypothetical protein
MSSRECIWVAYPVAIEKYLAVLKREFGARPNPQESESFLVGDPPLPFYAPQLIEGQLAITGFNRVPLSPDLLRALCAHPELAPLSAVVHWTEEQELIIHGTLEGFGKSLHAKER